MGRRRARIRKGGKGGAQTAGHEEDQAQAQAQDQAQDQTQPQQRASAKWSDSQPTIEKSKAYASMYLENPLSVVPTDERERFRAAVGRPLPASFRIHSRGMFAAALRDRLSPPLGDLVQGYPITDPENGQVILEHPPRPLSWNPWAFQMESSRKELRRVPALAALHRFLVVESEAGTIVRQEQVSMIPPCVLQVEPHHIVLDMCAAPGSKTSQLLEAMQHDSCSSRGVLLANDRDNKRAYLLVHQLRRLPSPSLIVTCNDASYYPRCTSLFPREDDDPGVFDRVLCDVPCSGDGTVRKNLDVFLSYVGSDGNTLHPVQVAIAFRAAVLCKVGGLIVYSTCSMNPVEDEAVVAEIIRHTNGALELVDAAPMLPGLVAHRGVKRWNVQFRGASRKELAKSSRTTGGGGSSSNTDSSAEMAKRPRVDDEKDEDLTYDPPRLLESLAEYEAWQAAHPGVAPADKLRASHFPPEDPAELDAIHIERCMRILPHDQDTGGFFIALLRKVRSTKLPAVEEPEGPAVEEPEGQGEDSMSPPLSPSLPVSPRAAATESAGVDRATPPSLPRVPPPARSARSAQSLQSELNFYQMITEDTYESLVKHFGIRELDRTCLFQRSEAKTARVMYYVNPVVRDVLLSNSEGKLQVVSAGVRSFQFASGKDREDLLDAGDVCAFRVSFEGCGHMLPFITKRKLELNLDDIAALLRAIVVPALEKQKAKKSRAKAGADAGAPEHKAHNVASAGSGATPAAPGGAPTSLPPAVHFEALSTEGFAKATEGLVTGGVVLLLVPGDRARFKKATQEWPGEFALPGWFGRAHLSALVKREDAEGLLRQFASLGLCEELP